MSLHVYCSHEHCTDWVAQPAATTVWHTRMLPATYRCCICGVLVCTLYVTNTLTGITTMTSALHWWRKKRPGRGRVKWAVPATKNQALQVEATTCAFAIHSRTARPPGSRRHVKHSFGGKLGLDHHCVPWRENATKEGTLWDNNVPELGLADKSSPTTSAAAWVFQGCTPHFGPLLYRTLSATRN